MSTKFLTSTEKKDIAHVITVIENAMDVLQLDSIAEHNGSITRLKDLKGDLTTGLLLAA